MKTYVRRRCYDKHWRCPGWAGGGLRHPKTARCKGGSLLVPGMWNREQTEVVPSDRWWAWRWHRCRTECGVLALPYVTRYLDPTWWWGIQRRHWVWGFRQWLDERQTRREWRRK